MRKFISQSVHFYRNQHLAVFLATILASAVLSGALIVGDSVKMSLLKKVQQRLGSISFVLAPQDRFVSENLSQSMNQNDSIQSATLLQMNGIAINPGEDLRNNRTHIWGMDSCFWKDSSLDNPLPVKREVIINDALARELKLKLSDPIVLKIQKQSLIPLNAPFTSIEENSLSIRCKIKAIIGKDHLGNFSLRNEQAEKFNVFIDREFLAKEMELKGLGNLIVVQDENNQTSTILNEALQESWQLKDASLSIKASEEGKYLDLVSDRVFIEDQISSKILDLNLQPQEILSYFVNSLEANQRSTPYSFVSATNRIDSTTAPLDSNEIIINTWLAQDLNVQIGDSIKLSYFVMGPMRKLSEESAHFIIKEIWDTETPPFSSSLMPEFPGLSTAGNCSDWDAGIPIDLKKIRDKDELYWDHYRGTPKAIINLNTAQKLWQNPFGKYTAFRFDARQFTQKELSEIILKALQPNDIGLVFNDARKAGNHAAQHGVDFGQLFLSLSFFVIMAAIILLVLIYQLQQAERVEETGLFLALGFSKKKILSLRLRESLLPIVFGSIIGSLVGILYNNCMIWGLNHVWNQAVHTDILESFVLPRTLLIGAFSSGLIAIISIIWVLWLQLKKTSISALRNQIKYSFKISKSSYYYAAIGILISVSLVLYSIFNSVENNSSLMLFSGFTILISMVFFLNIFWSRMNTNQGAIKHLNQLSVLNARRNKKRSLAIVILLALGIFTIVVTGANRKTFSGSSEKRSSGTGGFLFWGENSIPILFDLNSEEGRQEYGLNNNLDSCEFIQFKSLTGDDASCLNLNQVQQPQLLGVNATFFDDLKAFSFAQTIKDTEHPWKLLEENTPKNIIPAIADQTVIQWGLIKKLGDTLHYINENGEMLHLVLVGGLNGSIFQGNVLISEKAFVENYPSSAGSKFMLIDAPADQKDAVKKLLTNRLSDLGLQLTDTQTRLTQFYSVTNTYLNIFMILGGLGVIIGSLGLALILWKNIMERREEITLMRSLGFSKNQILKNLFTEHLWLIIIAMAIGLVAAIIGIIPSLVTSVFQISGTFLFWLVFIVFASSVFWVFIFVKWISNRINL